MSNSILGRMGNAVSDVGHGWGRTFKILAFVVLAQTLVFLIGFGGYHMHRIDSQAHMIEGFDMGFEAGLGTGLSSKCPPSFTFPAPKSDPPIDKT